MNAITAPSPTAVQMSALGPGGQSILAVLAKRTYRIDPGGRCVPDVEQLPLRAEGIFDPERRNLLIADVDTYPFKLCSDVVVRGHAYPAPSGTPAVAEVRIGGTVKTLSVIGDRRCTRGYDGRIVFSSPAPFEKIPLEYDRAYGGWDEAAEKRRGHPLARYGPYVHENTDLAAYSPFVYPRNRHGRGYLVDATPESIEALLLPNLEDPADRLRPERLAAGHPFAWHEMPVPAGTTWVPPSYFGRGAFLGMFPFWRPLPDRLAEFERGWLPPEVRGINILAAPPLALRFTNGASLGLQVPYLRPGETVALARLHSRAERLEIQLPGEWPVIQVDGRNGRLAPTEPVVHHVEIEPDEDRLCVVWRGAAPALRPYLPEELEKMPFRVDWRDR